MQLFYSKKFSKDLDGIEHDEKLKKRLLQLFNQMKQIHALADLTDVKKIQGYTGYYRIRIGDYRLGIKATTDGIEILRFLHRKDIYKRFP